MAVNRVDAERDVAAPPEIVYSYCVADVAKRPSWLPSNFSDFVVEKGGHGAGTVVRYTLTVGNRARTYHMSVAEPQPGTVLTETDANSSLVTRWTVSAQAGGSRVAIHTEWQGAGGIGGIFERLFAPAALKRVYDDVLTRLDQYATESAAS